jgi:hypothetical protein
MIVGFEGGPFPSMLEAERVAFNDASDDKEQTVGSST